MRFVLATLHRPTGVVDQLGSRLSFRPKITDLIVGCPACGLHYVGESTGYTRLTTAIEASRTARLLLDGECPDHAHHFAVSTGRDAG